MHVRVCAYSPEWVELYQKEALKIREILGAELVEIHHIGSTAVVGLQAKPIIDIMPVVRQIARVDAFNLAFAAIYERYEFGIPGRRYFRKGASNEPITHMFDVTNQTEIERHLAVRDYQAHPAVAAEYGALRRLAEQFPYDIEAYCEGKDVCKQMEQAALCG